MKLHYSAIIDELRRTQDAVLAHPGSTSLIKAQFRVLEDTIDKEFDYAIGEGVRIHRIAADKARADAEVYRRDLSRQKALGHKMAVMLQLAGLNVPDPDDDGVI